MGRIIAIVIVLPLLFFGALMVASETGGEVVTLETQGDDGRIYETSVWIVDFDRVAWLRAGDGESAWVKRLRAEPEVFVTRNGERATYRARIVEGLTGRVNAEMREKYGLADRIVTVAHDPESVVAIRLGSR